MASEKTDHGAQFSKYNGGLVCADNLWFQLTPQNMR